MESQAKKISICQLSEAVDARCSLSTRRGERQVVRPKLMARTVLQSLVKPVNSLSRFWAICGESGVGEGSHDATLRNRASSPTFIFVLSYPGANLAMEDMRLPEASD
jgi:hypothetical protein